MVDVAGRVVDAYRVLRWHCDNDDVECMRNQVILLGELIDELSFEIELTEMLRLESA